MSGSLRPLYLTGRASLRVEIDGPSLSVRQPARADGRYPLDRLSRVVSGAHVHWSTGAILGCMQAGVPVFFIDGNGKTVGSCHGDRRREATLANLIELAADVPDWVSRLEDWFRATHQRQAKTLIAELGLHGVSRSHPDAIHDQAVNRLCDCWGKAPGVPLRAYSALIRPWVEQMLLDQLGGDTRAMAWPVPGVHLGERFTALVARDAPRLLLATPPATRNNTPASRWAAETFQKNLPEHGRVLGRLFGSFEHWLRQLVL